MIRGMQRPVGESPTEGAFHASIYVIVYKLLLGIGESSAGIAIVLFGHEIYRSFQMSILKELSEDPHDLLARLSETILPDVLTHSTFVIGYLVVFGLAKILGAIGVIYKQNWGVDVLVGLTILLAPFQVIPLFLHPSLFHLIFLATGLLIALYLVEFRSGAWISRVLSRK
jgi:uncharacterized membrane protein